MKVSDAGLDHQIYVAKCLPNTLQIWEPCYFAILFYGFTWDIWPPGTGMHDRHWSGDLFRCLHNSIILFHLHISTSALNSLFFAINYPYLWDKNQEWNSEIVEFFSCHWKIHAEPWSDEFQKIRIQSPKITFRQRGRRVCVVSCIQFLKMGLASIFWRLGIQQSWRSEGQSLLLSRLTFASVTTLCTFSRVSALKAVRCWWTWNSLHLQLKHNSTVSEARFVLLNIVASSKLTLVLL